MRTGAWVLLWATTLGAGAAAGWERNPGGDAGAFGAWGLGARAEALARAYGARADDAAATYWNAAGLAALARTEITFGYGAPFAKVGGVTVGDAAVAKPMLYATGEEGGGSLGTLAAALAFRQAGGIYEADDNGLTGRTFADTDVALYIAYAHTLGEAGALGVTLKDITRAVGDYNDSGFGIDLAASYRPYAPLNFGVVLRNVVAPNFRLAQIKDVAPLTVEVSGCYDVFRWLAVMAAAQVTREGYYDFGAGWEVTPVKYVALRGGYAGDRRPRIGLGLAWGDFRFDYGARLGGALGDSHLASVSFLFGGPAAAEESAPAGDEGYIEFTPEDEGEDTGGAEDGEGDAGGEGETEPPGLLDLGLP